MTLAKLIIYFIIAYMLLRFVRRMAGGFASSAASSRDPRRTRRASPEPRISSSQTVRCENCGVFVTEKSALLIGDKGFCSKACADSGVHRS
jgi:hypothetical protein